MKPARPIATLVAVLLLLAASSGGVCALEVESGRVRLVLHEGSGRYSLYIRSVDEEPRYVPLFVDQDPRTSWLSVVVDGRIHRLGEGGEFRETAVSRTPQGARFQWESRTLRITQEFTFVAPAGALSATGVRIQLILTNLGASAVSVGVRDCLDTYLGEDQAAHFRTQPGGDVTAESTVTRERMVAWWVSAGKGGEGVACQRLTSGAGVTPPDRIVFANWKRLNQVSWSYDTSIGRSFNLLPYSINDSAVCHYYEPLAVAPGESRSIVSILGNYSPAGYVAAESSVQPAPTAAAPTAAAAAPSFPGEGSPGTGLADIRSALQRLNDLLREIDGKLSSGQPLTDEDVRLIQQALSGIKSRSEPYLQDQ